MSKQKKDTTGGEGFKAEEHIKQGKSYFRDLSANSGERIPQIHLTKQSFILRDGHDIRIDKYGIVRVEKSTAAKQRKIKVPVAAASQKPVAASFHPLSETNYSLNELLDYPAGLMAISSAGLSFEAFAQIAALSVFPLKEWAVFLNVSEQEILSFQKENKVFSQAQTELILQIAQLQKLGEEVLGSRDNFIVWASAPSLALEGKTPKEFLVSIFGIQMLTTELHRIEYGVLA